MTDYGIGIILIFFKEFLGSRKCNLVDVFLNVVGSHTDAMVGNRQSASLLIDGYADIHLAQHTFEFTKRG